MGTFIFFQLKPIIFFCLQYSKIHKFILLGFQGLLDTGAATWGLGDDSQTGWSASILLKCPILHKSTLHVSSFIDEDSIEQDTSQLYIDEIKPLLLQFFTMISCKGDSSGILTDLFCIDEKVHLLPTSEILYEICLV